MTIEDQVLVVSWVYEGNEDQSKSFGLVVEDEELSNALNEYLEDHPEIEVYRKESNIAATSEGYLGAFWESDLVESN